MTPHLIQATEPPAPPASGQTPSAEAVKGHLEAGMGFHSMLQMDDGHFPGDYGGPMFLLPGLIIACYVTGSLDTVFSPQHKHEMLRYFRNHQNEDGGFGLHIEGASTMFGTGLWYATWVLAWGCRCWQAMLRIRLLTYMARQQRQPPRCMSSAAVLAIVLPPLPPPHPASRGQCICHCHDRRHSALTHACAAAAPSCETPLAIAALPGFKQLATAKAAPSPYQVHACMHSCGVNSLGRHRLNDHACAVTCP